MCANPLLDSGAADRSPEGHPDVQLEPVLGDIEACVETGHVRNAVALLRSLVPSYLPSQTLIEDAASPAVSRVA